MLDGIETWLPRSVRARAATVARDARMIAGRLRWFEGEPTGVGKIGLAEFRFELPGGVGTLVLTEASTQKRASIHVVEGREAIPGTGRALYSLSRRP